MKKSLEETPDECTEFTLQLRRKLEAGSSLRNDLNRLFEFLQAQDRAWRKANKRTGSRAVKRTRRAAAPAAKSPARARAKR